MFPRSRLKSLPLPLFLLVCAVGLFLWSRGQYGRPPEIEAIDPQIGFPGEEMVIRGRYFGADAHRGEVMIAGITPRRSQIRLWSDHEIRLTIPGSVGSGLVVVRTSKGESRGTLFTNRSHVPGQIFRGRDPITPKAEALSPQSAVPGNPVTLEGSRLGHSREGSRLYVSRSQGGRDFLEVGPSYIDSWTDRGIRFRVPPDAGSGPVTVERRGRMSSPVVLEVYSPVGRRSYGQRRRITLQTTQILRVTGALGENGFYLRIPRPAQDYRQSHGDIIRKTDDSFYAVNSKSLLYHFRRLQSGDVRSISQDYMVETAEVICEVDPRGIVARYDRKLPFYRSLTSPDPWIPSEDQSISWAAGRAARGTNDPLRKARQLYNYTLDRLEQAGPAERRQAGDLASPEVVIDSHVAGASGYARLFAALLRNQGIPARTVRGVLVQEGPQAVFHEWTEFYLEDFGWYPADPYLADSPAGELKFPGGYRLKDEAREFYWGGMDPYHVAFTRGILAGGGMSPEGRGEARDNALGILENAEEPWGGVSGWHVDWNRIRVTGLVDP